MATPFGLEPDENNLALSQGLLGLGAGLLSGSFGHYGAFAPALGSGVQGFQQGYSNSIDQNLKLKAFKQNQLLQNAQIQNYQSEVEARKAKLDEERRLQDIQTAADAFARGGEGSSVASGGPLSPTQPTQPSGVLSQVTAPPIGPGATALAGGAGPVGGGAGYGATGSPVPGASNSIPVLSNAPANTVPAQQPKLDSNGNYTIPPTSVDAKFASPLLDPDYWLKTSEYKRKYGDMKGAIADAEQAKKLRLENFNLDKDERDKPVEGLPGFTFNPKDSTFKKDGKAVDADTVLKAKFDLAEHGANKTITNVNAYTPASEEAQRDFIKSTRATYDTLKQGQATLDNIEKAKELIPKAAKFMGTGGESTLNAVKFLNNRLGLNISTEGVKNAEELRSRAFFGIMDNLKKMDSQPSESQQAALRQALGSLDTDPNALGAVLDAFGDTIRSKVELHNSEVQSAIDRGVKFPYDPIVKLKPKTVSTKPTMLPKGVTIEEVK